MSEEAKQKVQQKFRESPVNSADCQIEQICHEGVSDRVIRNVMLRMVSTTGVALARRQVQLSELEYPKSDCIQVALVLEAFEEVRLLTSNKDAKGNCYIEPAHDALIRSWSKINLWLNERQDKVEPKQQFAPFTALKSSLLKLTTPASPKIPEVASDLSKPVNTKPARWLNRSKSEAPLKVNLQLQRELTVASGNWLNIRQKEGNHKAIGFLWNADPRLPQLEQIQQSANNWFNQRETEFVALSLQRKRNNRRRSAGAIIVGFTLLIRLTVLALLRAREAQMGKIDALRASSEALLLSNQQLESVQESLRTGKALQQLVWTDPELEDRVRKTLQKVLYGVKEYNRLQVDRPIGSVAFSPDDQMIATVSLDNDGIVQLWKPDGSFIPWSHNGRQFSLTSKTNGPKSFPVVASSADGQIVAVDYMGRLLLFNTKDGANPIPISAVAFNPTKKILALAVADRVVLLSLAGDRLLSSLSGRRGEIAALAFNGDGKTLATASYAEQKKSGQCKSGM